MRESANNAIPCIKIIWPFLLDAITLGGVEFGFHGEHNPARHFVLECEDILKRPLITLCPHLSTSRCVRKLDTYPDLSTRPPDAALKNVPHAEIAADLFDTHSLALVGMMT